MSTDTAILTMACEISRQQLWKTLRGRQLIRCYIKTIDDEDQRWKEHFGGIRKELTEHELFWEKRLMKFIKIFSEERKHSSRFLRILTLVGAIGVCSLGFVFLSNLNQTWIDLATPLLFIPMMISAGLLVAEIKHPNRALLDVFNEALLD